MKIIDFLFPKYCINCSQKWEYLCPQCKKKLIPHPEICPYCHTYSKFYQTCFTCKNKENSYLKWLIIWFSYDQTLKNLIFRLKYFHKKNISEFLAQRLFLVIQTNQILQYQTNVLKQKIFISYVPSHRYRKYFVKWYNPSKEIAKLLADKLNLECIDIVQKTKHTRQQVWLSKIQREKNLKSIFKVKQSAIKQIQWNEIIIIVDDVTTTWATLKEISQTIQAMYPQTSIRWAVLWRHNS